MSGNGRACADTEAAAMIAAAERAEREKAARSPDGPAVSVLHKARRRPAAARRTRPVLMSAGAFFLMRPAVWRASTLRALAVGMRAVADKRAPTEERDLAAYLEVP